MIAATHVVVGATDTVVVLHDGRIRVTDGRQTVTIEVHDAGTAHRLSEALAVVRDALASQKRERVALLERVEAVG